jgi:RHS repeat-associated protein
LAVHNRAFILSDGAAVSASDLSTMSLFDIPLAEGVTREFLLHHRMCPREIGTDAALVVAAAHGAALDAADDLAFAYGRAVRVEQAGAVEIESVTLESAARGTNVFRDYDNGGNVSFGTDIPHSKVDGETQRRSSRFYYGADDRLRQIQRYARERFAGTVGNDDLIQEFRYDALGRRILLRSQHEPYCSSNCHDAIERYIWDGAQLLYELRARGSDGSDLELATGTGTQYGRTGYVHGPGIDAPLGVMRSSHSIGTFLVVPHTNWRGQYEKGTRGDGSLCSSSTCGVIDWPAPKVRSYRDGIDRPRGDWIGALIHDQRDQSGLLHRRNRYYDPATGQFTQIDPIGLAGGLNLYGFANGDPVNYSDPFGLRAMHCPPDCDESDAAWASAGASVGFWLGGGGGLIGGLSCGPGAPACSAGGSIAGASAGSAAGAAAGLGINNLVDGLANMFSRQSDAVKTGGGTTEDDRRALREAPE